MASPDKKSFLLRINPEVWVEIERLPAQARAYLDRIEQVSGVPIHLISTSPDREHTIMKKHPFSQA